MICIYIRVCLCVFLSVCVSLWTNERTTPTYINSYKDSIRFDQTRDQKYIWLFPFCSFTLYFISFQSSSTIISKITKIYMPSGIFLNCGELIISYLFNLIIYFFLNVESVALFHAPVIIFLLVSRCCMVMLPCINAIF